MEPGQVNQLNIKLFGDADDELRHSGQVRWCAGAPVLCFTSGSSGCAQPPTLFLVSKIDIFALGVSMVANYLWENRADRGPSGNDQCVLLRSLSNLLRRHGVRRWNL